MCLASPDEKGKLAEKMCIEAFTSDFADRDMRYDVLSKNPKKLEDALFADVRYEALHEGVTTPQPQVVFDPASYVYDDKGMKKKNVRAVEIHQDKQRELEKSLEAQKSLNDENQRKILDQQQQLDSWRTWNDKQTRLQASWCAQYSQPQTVQQDWRQISQASGGVPQGDTEQYTSTYKGHSGRGRAAHNTGNMQGDTQSPIVFYML